MNALRDLTVIKYDEGAKTIFFPSAEERDITPPLYPFA
jgi:hypothetical protein